MTTVHLDLDTIVNDLEKQKEISELVAEDLKSYLGGLEEYVIDIDCPWAQYIEFGSDPADPEKAPGDPPVYDDICDDWVTEVRLKFRDWAQDKFHLDADGRKERGDAVYFHTMKKGMSASPFIRPAEYYTTEDLMAHPEKYFIEDQNPIELICTNMVDHMAMQIEANNSIDSGGLLRSIRVVKASEIADADEPEDLKQIPEYVWKDRSLDRHGNKIKPRGSTI